MGLVSKLLLLLLLLSRRPRPMPVGACLLLLLLSPLVVLPLLLLLGVVLHRLLLLGVRTALMLAAANIQKPTTAPAAAAATVSIGRTTKTVDACMTESTHVSTEDMGPKPSSCKAVQVSRQAGDSRRDSRRLVSQEPKDACCDIKKLLWVCCNAYCTCHDAAWAYGPHLLGSNSLVLL